MALIASALRDRQTSSFSGSEPADPPCSTLCGYWACDSYAPPGPYDGCQACCPDAGGCVPMSDTDCGACGTECTGTTMCVPVLYGMPPPFGGYCLFECVEPIPEWTLDTSTDGDAPLD